MTQLENAKRGNITPLMKKIALDEDLSPEVICEKLANNRIVILHSKLNNIKPIAIGEGLRIKVNANIGSSVKNTPVNIVTANTAQAIENENVCSLKFFRNYSFQTRSVGLNSGL